MKRAETNDGRTDRTIGEKSYAPNQTTRTNYGVIVSPLEVDGGTFRLDVVDVQIIVLRL